ncbi:sulfatase-like hydrolase/transferase [Mariniblastus fucicola]|uniref:Arylsulfatase n=1 Tax=Mariniblastus fucicola TaxID=980251 RepID=A0A5B9PQX3_9BACT|nr:sulfatase-like hydrolase/transferase [Mariniblastus fucicola]QEG24713.1 Arylsulfatase [Mariniblastus fucicola]
MRELREVVQELRRFSRNAVIAIAAVMSLVASGVGAMLRFDEHEPQVDRKPNIVLINLDDCDVDLVDDEKLKHFPNLSELAKTSTRFTNCHVTTPLCGPSRACLFRSQYAHNTGYRTNRANLDVGSGFTGGTQYFMDSGLAADQLPVWMKRAGYHTMLVGKYFQGKTEHVPVPGWDRFIALGGNRYIGRIARFNFFPDGKIDIGPVHGYRTEIETDDVVGLLDEYASEGDPEKPFFLYLAPVAPHVGALNEDPVPEKWKDRFLDVKLPSSASFNEDDVSDKPVAYRDTLKLSEKEVAALVVSQRRRLIAMSGVDEMVQRIRKKIADLGLEENTIVILTSDHGYLMGEHRMHGKSFPLIKATQVPLWVHWPGVTTSRNAGQLLAHIDISATVADLGGASIPDFADGRSFSKLLTDDSITAADAIRQSVLVENWESRLNSVSKRKIVYSSMIRPGSMYTQWATGEKEYYDLESDPHQLENEFANLSAAEKSSLRAELHSIRLNSSQDAGTTATLSFPTVNRSYFGPETELEGFAESAAQVGPVTYSIKRKQTGEFWDGTAWSQQPTRMPAEQPVEAGLLREWHARPRVKGLDPGEVLSIEVHAADASERQASIRKLDVIYDSSPPVVRISRPNNQMGYPEFANFGGMIEDDRGSDDVKLSIFNLDTLEYFNGSEWTTDESQVSVLVNTETGRWHTRHPLPEGRYEIKAFGKDAAGNWSAASEPVRCLVDRSLQRKRMLDDEIR